MYIFGNTQEQLQRDQEDEYEEALTLSVLFLSGMHQPEKNLPLQAFKVEPRIGKICIQIHFFQKQPVYR